ncbi:MAG TPA: tetratricopeptide repeat protein [Planctomycetaceae bacterium]|jgi:tetratricopeptide (TPR) repeat protein|nr:tetratricopeptide repeat protein [Planctomycetaceae bacterium]
MKPTNKQRGVKAVPPPERRWVWPLGLTGSDILLGGLLIVATLAVYIQVRGFDFVIVDDALYVGDNEHVRDGISFGNLRWALTTFRDGNWFPLTWISLMIDASFYQLWSGGYHITNLAIHALNVLLVFAVFSKMTRNAPQSALAAALFAVHPLHVQSVAWVAERKDVLSMCFGLCSLYAYVSYGQSGRTRGLIVSWSFFFCSLCSKQTFVTLPFVLLLLDYWPLGRLFAARAQVGYEQGETDNGDLRSDARRVGLGRLLIEKIPFFVLSAVFCVLAAYAQSQNGAVLSLEVIPFGTRIMNALVVYRLYLQKALLPTGLVAYYPHPGSRLSLVDVVISVVFLVVVSGLAALYARRRPYFLVGWLWYLGTLVPMIGLVQLSGQQMADRYTYLPLLGCYLAMVWLVTPLATRLIARPIVRQATAAAIVVFYGSIAFVQAGYWHDSISLYRHAVEAGEQNPYSLTTLGWAYANEKRFDEALPPLQQAVELTPDFGQAQFLLGCVLQGKSQFDEAADHFRAALATDDGNAAAHLNLGTILMARREYAQARHELDRVVELDPGNARVQANLAELCLQLRNYEESLAHGKRALELDPNQTRYRRLIVIALRDQGRLDEAIDQLRQLVAVAPDDRASQRELARLLAQRNSKSRATKP